ncbi:hypothetical protein FRC09_007921 [Ceratobasidium sp. 395]|nr:hypothetical protein FRC09_007921 [Ceratobasidium sp. 395]
MPASPDMSAFCSDTKEFEKWAWQVHCDPLPSTLDPEHLPTPLGRMVQDSQKIPNWVYDKESDQHRLFKLAYPYAKIPDFTDPPPDIIYTEESPVPDPFFLALHHILYASNQHVKLLVAGGVPQENKTALRQPIDRLARYVFDEELDEELDEKLGTDRFIARLECELKGTLTTDYTADSVVFFRAKPLQDERFSSGQREVMVCTKAEPGDKLDFIHWATQYKPDSKLLDEACRQTCCVMVSGLWQRHAIGRMSDFVFGTAHAADSMIVYAARWEAVSSDGFSKLDRIKIYQIGKYETRNAVDMMKYYLLLRASVKVAEGYLEGILNDSRLVEKIEARAKRFARPLPKRGQGDGIDETGQQEGEWDRRSS